MRYHPVHNFTKASTARSFRNMGKPYFRPGLVPGSSNLVNALKARAGSSSPAGDSLFTRTERPQPCTHFSPTSVQLKSEINGAFPCKRHQMQHLEFCTILLQTRRSEVRVPRGA